MADELITIQRMCRWCLQEYKMDVPLDGMKKYEAGYHIQSAFNMLPAAQREQIMTGTHDKCWDEMWCDQSEHCTVHEGAKCPAIVLKNKFAKEGK